MRDLVTRLREIVRQDPRAAPPVRELTYVPDFGSGGTPDAEEAAARLGGTLHRVGASRCVVVEHAWAPDEWYGRRQIASLVLEPDAPIGLFDLRANARPDWSSRVVFFDIETTGLSGGAGTLPFLAGCGWFEDGGFRVRQFFLAGPSGEPALLDALGDVFQTASLLVTYNGRSFDVPLMDTRWAFHRSEPPTEAVPHFDMLPSARRLWGQRDSNTGPPDAGRSCSLSSLECSVLGFHRLRDVAGFEIPSRYFQFLRSGHRAAIDGVFEHNRHDLISLAALTAHALWLAREGPEACREAAEQVALGRLYERAGDSDRAARAFELAAASDEPQVQRQALSRLAVLLRRQARHAESAAAWQGVLELAACEPHVLGPLDRRAALALAIHHEHRARDLGVARRYAEALRAEATGRLRQAVEHRLGRLERKIRTSEQLSWD